MEETSHRSKPFVNRRTSTSAVLSAETFESPAPSRSSQLFMQLYTHSFPQYTAAIVNASKCTTSMSCKLPVSTRSAFRFLYWLSVIESNSNACRGHQGGLPLKGELTPKCRFLVECPFKTMNTVEMTSILLANSTVFMVLFSSQVPLFYDWFL